MKYSGVSVITIFQCNTVNAHLKCVMDIEKKHETTEKNKKKVLVLGRNHNLYNIISGGLSPFFNQIYSHDRLLCRSFSRMCKPTLLEASVGHSALSCWLACRIRGVRERGREGGEANSGNRQRRTEPN